MLLDARNYNYDMRKLKNLKLLGETRLIHGVGHVTFEEDVPEHVAEACEALGLDWVDGLSVPADLENGSDDAEDADGGEADSDAGETPRMASVLGGEADSDTGETASMPSVLNGEESNSKKKKK